MKARPVDLLVDWANKQSNWIRAITAEVIEFRSPLGEASLDKHYTNYLREKELSEGAAVTVGTLERDATGAASEEGLAVTAIKAVKNVNALASGQTVAFNKGLTVLFGENGAGKTGYVRILKSVAKVRNVEPVLSDIRKKSVTSPEANIEYQLGSGDAKNLSWKGEEGLAPLTRIDVFDARVLRVHVDDELSYSYTPSELALFQYVNEAVAEIKGRLDRDRKERTNPRNPFISRFEADSPLHAKIESLGAATDVGELRKLASLAEEEEAELPGLRDRVEALRGGATELRLQSTKQSIVAGQAIKAAVDALVGFDRDAYEGARLEHRRVSELIRTQSAKQLEGAGIPGLFGRTWTQFINGASAYWRETQKDGYPLEDDPCIYCRQPLRDDAVKLLRAYWEHCEGDLQTKLAEIETSRAALIEVLTKLDAQRLREYAVTFADSDDQKLQLAKFIDELGGVQEAARLGGRDSSDLRPEEYC